jgi:hypothetical protein
MIFRIDDINANSDIEKIVEMEEMILSRFPRAGIINCITILSGESDNGSAYQEIKPWDADLPKAGKMFNLEWTKLLKGEIASHGLWHIQHGKAGKELQEYSIRTSCEILETRYFCPPFIDINKDTVDICLKSGITIIGTEKKWINIERNEIGSNDMLLFHPWKMSIEELKNKLK